MLQYWTNYGISCVRHNADGTQIEKLFVHVLIYGIPMFPEMLARDDVIARIKAGKNFITLIKDADGRLVHGEKIHPLKEKFLRTDPNETEEDNLGELPNCAGKFFG